DGLSRSQFRQGSLPMGGLLGAITKVVVGIGLFGSHPQVRRIRARTMSSYDGRVSRLLGVSLLTNRCEMAFLRWRSSREQTSDPERSPKPINISESSVQSPDA